MLRAGIVGLPNVGKSTLFNAVTRTRKAEAANYPFCTIDPNVGIVTVPDARLCELQKIAKTRSAQRGKGPPPPYGLEANFYGRWKPDGPVPGLFLGTTGVNSGVPVLRDSR